MPDRVKVKKRVSGSCIRFCFRYHLKVNRAIKWEIFIRYSMHHILKCYSYRSAFSFLPFSGMELQSEVISTVYHIVSLTIIIIIYYRALIHLRLRIRSAHNYIAICVRSEQSGSVITNNVQFLNVLNCPVIIDKQLQILLRP